ncbi:hypothetical protein EDE11_1301, partial [Methylomonas methanica]
MHPFCFSCNTKLSRLVKNPQIFPLTHGRRHFFALKLTPKPSFEE